MPGRRAFLFTLACLCSLLSTAQTYYAIGPGILYRIDLDFSGCGELCTLTEIGPTPYVTLGTTFCPDGNLYGAIDNYIWQIDTATGDTTLVASGITGSETQGLICLEDSLLYTLLNETELMEVNINSDMVTLLGNTGFDIDEEFGSFNNFHYFNTIGTIVSVDLANPANSMEVFTYDHTEIFIAGLTASPLCNTLLAINSYQDELISLNLADGTITHLCDLPDMVTNITSMQEFATPICTALTDLDCNDSSGAPGANFNAGTYDCLSDSLRIADDDINIINDDRIITMTINILSPVPDDPYEDIIMSAGVPGISASGLGTASVVLTNDGMASATDFKEALRRLFYINTTLHPTAGPRVIQVQFTTETGLMSNIANAFFEIVDLPSLIVDLGPDQLICEGSSATFDAGHPGATYAWSNAETSQTINATTEGSYAVTVSDNLNCPGTDTATLTLMPNINVSLVGDESTCQNSPASFTLVTNATIPIDIEVSISTGGTYTFLNVIGNLPFTGDPAVTTTYEIISITADVPACFEMTDSVQTVVVNPVYFAEMNFGLCGGDSIWLGYYWEFNAGVYNIQLQTVNGCDSIILYTIESLPADIITLHQNTCDPTADGVFITTLPNANGCDTIVQLTVTYVPPDTINIAGVSCKLAETGTDTLELTNVYGCDSIVIMGIQYAPPEDTTFISAVTCDPAQVETTVLLLTTANDCDSLVIEEIVLSVTDTSFLFASTCDPAMIGINHEVLAGSDGCDSIIVTTTTGIPPDTTQLFETTCDSSKLGIVTNVLSNVLGCDSIVIITTSYSSSDSIFISLPTCDAAMAGITYATYQSQLGCDSIVVTTHVFIPPVEVDVIDYTCDPSLVGTVVDTFIGYLGCDSLVFTEIRLLPSSSTALSSTTCKSAEAGVFTTVLLNQYGCDSIITLTVALLPIDTTWVYTKTCLPGEVDTIAVLLTDPEGCDSVVMNAISLFPTSIITLESAFDYHGFDVSCHDADDGAVIASVQGTGPYAYAWSNGNPGQDLENVAAGIHTVSVTDGNGCISIASIELTAPPVLMALFEVNALACDENNGGSVTITSSGGVSGYQYAIQGQPFQDAPVLAGLAEGVHVCVVKDANDCEVNGIVRIDIPLAVDVELGEDRYINSGESVTIDAVYTLPVDSILTRKWFSDSDTLCLDCDELRVTPALTTVYYMEVVSTDGCVDTDTITVHVLQDKEVFIPNVFSPNFDGTNDRLQIMTKPNVTGISRMEIFDRWGNVVFAKSNLPPNDPANGWDGSWNDKPLNPGVFIYRIVVEFIDGSQAMFQGDITLIR